jgi:hypothetical protein
MGSGDSARIICVPYSSMYGWHMQRCGADRGAGRDNRLLDEKDAMSLGGLGEASGTVG